MNKWRIDADRVPWLELVEIWLAKRVGEKWFMFRTIELARDMETPGMVPEPTIRMPTGAAQQLIDALWRAGLRPSEGTGSAGALAATQKHLDDMRSMVFDGRESIMGMLAWLQRLAAEGTVVINNTTKGE